MRTVPLRFSSFKDRASGHDRSRMDGESRRTKLIRELLYGTDHGGRVTHVAVKGQCRAAAAADFVCDLPAGNVIAIEHADGRAFSGETQAYSASDSISSSGD